MPIMETLRQEHREFMRLFVEIRNTKENSAARREELFKRLKAGLETHTQFENEIFYPAVREHPDGKPAIDEALREHDQVATMLEWLDSHPKGGNDWIPQLLEMEQLLTHHIREEESKVFEMAKSVINDSRDLDMQSQYDAERGKDTRKIA